MDYLLLQILLFLILAAVVGFFIGWIVRGFGFESRLLASENHWRGRHHVLQNENNRLQSELDDALAQEETSAPEELPQKKESLETIQQEVTVLDLPFKSTQLSSTDPRNHPLERLRSEIAQGEPTQTSEDQTVEENNNVDLPSSSFPPVSLNQPQGTEDDLKLISGIGPKIESTLNSLGIYHFSQIADFTEDNINWVNEHLQFKGRIERENWISQAKKLVQ